MTNSIPSKIKDEDPHQKLVLEKVSITELALPSSLKKRLKKEEINTFGELEQAFKKDRLKQIQGIGDASLRDIDNAIKAFRHQFTESNTNTAIAERWYQKGTVQAAIATGVFLLIIAIVGKMIPDSSNSSVNTNDVSSQIQQNVLDPEQVCLRGKFGR